MNKYVYIHKQAHAQTHTHMCISLFFNIFFLFYVIMKNYLHVQYDSHEPCMAFDHLKCA